MPDIITGKIFVDGEKGITATKMNQIIGQAVVQPDFYNNKPSSSTLDPTDVLLELKSTNTYAQVTGANLINSVSSQVNVLPQIYSTRLRSFSSIGNGNFEIDQRNVGASVSLSGASGFTWIDRWQINRATSTTAVISAQQMAGPVLLPGTNFAVSSKFLRITVTTVQATLAAADYCFISQFIEGPMLRELIGDVHSASVLVRSSVAGLQFGLTLNDGLATPTQTLTNLCTIPTGGTWTLLQLPNLPVWPVGGTFPITPGSNGYIFRICLAAGSNWLNAANATWQSAYKIGATGQGNFLGSLVNSTFDIALVQHEPGNVCTNPTIDLPWQQNYDACLRYWQKTYSYPTAPGTATLVGQRVWGVQPAGTVGINPAGFIKPMAKAPTVTIYNPGTGASGSVRDSASTDHTGAAAGNIGDAGFPSVSFTTALAAVGYVTGHYVADSTW